MPIKFSIIITLFLSLFWQQQTFAAVQMQASVSDNNVFLGDRFTLTIEINDTDSDYQLNTKVLEKDFSVSSPSRRSNKNYINGTWSSQTKWIVGLRAKRIGELTIPSLKIGSLSSSPIKISVNEPSKQATKTENNLIFIENSINKNTLYLNQPLIFTSKIYIAQNTEQLQFSEPTLSDAVISVYNNDKQDQIIRDGIRYNTITRQFQIGINKPGTFTINSPVLTGSAIVNRNSYKPFNIRGDSLQVTIKEKPEGYQGEWLISDDVRLFEDSKITEQSYHAGEPITREITLQVASITQDKMPNISFNYPQDLRFYPDQDELSEGDSKGSDLHYIQRTIRHAIIANQAGELTLPEIKLAWWNSKTDKQEFAVLPAQTLTILPAEGNSDTVEPPVIKVDTAKEKTKTAIVVDDSRLIIWQIISAILFLALIILISYHLYYRRSQHITKNNKPLPIKDKSYIRLQEVLKKQQAPLAYQALLHYTQSEFPSLKSLSQLAEYTNLTDQEKTQLSAEIKTLENSCANPSNTWDSTQLSELLKKYNQSKNSQRNKNIMELNP